MFAQTLDARSGEKECPSEPCPALFFARKKNSSTPLSCNHAFFRSRRLRAPSLLWLLGALARGTGGAASAHTRACMRRDFNLEKVPGELNVTLFMLRFLRRKNISVHVDFAGV